MEDNSLWSVGCVLAFGIGLFRVILGVVNANSIRASNLKKVGLTYSYLDWNFTEKKKTWKNFVFFIVLELGISVAFSWLQVIYISAVVLINYLRKGEIPEAIKLLQFKLNKLSLTKDEVVKVQVEINKVLGIDGPVFTGENSWGDEDDPNHLDIEKGEWRVELDVYPSKYMFAIKSWTPDGTSGKSTYQYKVSKDGIQYRLFEEKNDYSYKEEFIVKDGVLLESEMRAKDSKFFFDPIEERIAKYKKHLEWSDDLQGKIKYFVLSKHPNEILPHELRTMARAELERIKIGVAQFTKMVSELGMSPIDNGKTLDFRYPENSTEADRERINVLFEEESMKKFGIRKYQMSNFPTVEKEYLEFLGEKKAA